MGYKKEEFSSFSSNETDYQNARGLLSIDLEDDIYYDESNGNVIVFDGNMANVLTGMGRTYNTYDMTSPADISAMNALPQIFTPTKFPYCYEIIKDEKYLIFIPGIKSKNTPFVSIINNDDLSNILMDPPNAPITKLNSKNYKNYLTLFNIDPTNNLYYDTDTMNVIHIVGNVARVIDGSTGKTMSYDLMNQNDITSMNNIPTTANITITTYLYEIKPASKYMIYIPSTEGTFISIIDTSSSKNLATTGTAQNAPSPNVTGPTAPNVTGSTPYLGKEPSSSLGPAAPVVTESTPYLGKEPSSSLGPAAPVVTGSISSLGPAAPSTLEPSTVVELKQYFADKNPERPGLILGVSYNADKTLFENRKPTTVTYVREKSGEKFYTFYKISEIKESGINKNKDVIYNVKVTKDPTDEGVNVLGDRIFDEKK